MNTDQNTRHIYKTEDIDWNGLEKYPVRMRMDSNSLSTIMKVPYSQKRILRKWSCCVSGIPT